jgi:hypothetical protein
MKSMGFKCQFMSIDLGHTIATPLVNRRNLKKHKRKVLNNKLTPQKNEDNNPQKSSLLAFCWGDNDMKRRRKNK